MTRSRSAALLLALALTAGGTSACSGDGGATSTTTVPTADASSTGPGEPLPSSSGSGGAAAASGSPTVASSTDAASTSTPGEPSAGAAVVDRLLVAADVPGSTQALAPGRAAGESRRVATVTITCAGLPSSFPSFPTEDAFVSVMQIGGGTVSSAIRVFPTKSSAADYLAEWQRRLDRCAGDDSAPTRWAPGDGYGDDSVGADGSVPSIGPTLDFFVRDGRSVAEVYVLLTDLTDQQLVAVTARAAEKLLG